MTELPSKLFFRIGEVAGLVGVEPHVLRYWEREFRSIRPTKSAKGQRVYSRKDVENLLRVRDLLYRDGFTIAGAKKRLQRGGVEAFVPSDPGGLPAVAPLGTGAVSSGASSLAFAPAEPEAANARLVPHAAPSMAGPSHDRAFGAHASVAAQPAAAPGTGAASAVRERLEAMRAEVEAFLGELDDSHRADRRHRD